MKRKIAKPRKAAFACIAAACIMNLSGCVTGPVYQNYAGEGAACVSGDTANFWKFFSEGEAHVRIAEIDGMPTHGVGPHCFVAGGHRLGIRADNNYHAVIEYIDLDFMENAKYRLRANLRGVSFVFQFEDVTSNNPKLVREFSLKVGSISQPTTVPIFIPIKR